MTFKLPASFLLSALLMLHVADSAAMPEQCIQALDRQWACPNLLYTKAPIGADNEKQLICICKTDFVKYLTEPEDDTQKILQRMDLQDILAEYQISEQQLMDIMQNNY